MSERQPLSSVHSELSEQAQGQELKPQVRLPELSDSISVHHRQEQPKV